jgi:hypothetical protein
MDFIVLPVANALTGASVPDNGGRTMFASGP